MDAQLIIFPQPAVAYNIAPNLFSSMNKAVSDACQKMEWTGTMWVTSKAAFTPWLVQVKYVAEVESRD